MKKQATVSILSLMRGGEHGMSRDTIGLKITDCKSLAACISIIRKYRGGSMAEIKSAIQSNGYVLSFDYADRFGVKKVIRCFEELQTAGIGVQLYEMDDEPTTLKFLKTLDNTYNEISDEIDSEEE